MTSQPMFPAPVGQVFEISFVTFMARAPVGRPPDRLQGSAATGPHRGASPATSPRRTRPPHRPSLPASKRSPGHEAAAPPEKTRPEAAEPPGATPATPILQVLIFSNTNLPEQEFSAQTEKISRVGSYDRDTRSWYTWIPLAHAERAAEMLTTLFETARLHGATIQVRAQRAGESSQSGQAP